MKRFYARYACTDINTGPLYHVIDSSVNEPVSVKMPYHEANDQAEARNNGTFNPAINMESWLAQLNFEPTKADDIIDRWVATFEPQVTQAITDAVIHGEGLMEIQIGVGGVNLDVRTVPADEFRCVWNPSDKADDHG